MALLNSVPLGERASDGTDELNLVQGLHAIEHHMERIVVARNLERALHDLLCARRTEIANHRLVESCEIQWQMRERGCGCS